MHPVENFTVAAILGLFGLPAGEMILVSFIILVLAGGVTGWGASWNERKKGIRDVLNVWKKAFGSNPVLVALSFILAAIAVFLVVHGFSK